MPRNDSSFTLAELLVALSVVALLVLLLSHLVDNAASITNLGNARMDTDSQARPLFERMALDFTHMVRRRDVSYYLKSADVPMHGNDLAGFYSTVPGYYPTTPSPISVIAYRVNSGSSNSAAYNCLERMGKGLDWNGASTTNTPVLFLPLTIHDAWPSVTSSSAYDDVDPARTTYEIIAPQVFRFEYYYLEQTTGNLVPHPGAWTSLSTIAIKDAAAIVAAIAVIDPKAKALLSKAQIATLANSLPDFTSGWGPGELLAQWQATLNGVTNIPRAAVSGIRLYERYFYISDQ